VGARSAAAILLSMGVRRQPPASAPAMHSSKGYKAPGGAVGGKPVKRWLA